MNAIYVEGNKEAQPIDQDNMPTPEKYGSTNEALAQDNNTHLRFARIVELNHLSSRLFFFAGMLCMVYFVLLAFEFGGQWTINRTVALLILGFIVICASLGVSVNLIKLRIQRSD